MTLDNEILILNYTTNKRKVIILGVFAVVVILVVILLTVSLNSGIKSETNKIESEITQTTPKKVVKKCPDLPERICNGKVTVNYRPQPGINLPGTNITFECKIGFQLVSKISEFICQENGTWNALKEEVVCQEVQYEFYATPYESTFEEARKHCQSLGGDLATDNLRNDLITFKRKEDIGNITYGRGPGYSHWVGVVVDRNNTANLRYIDDNSIVHHEKPNNTLHFSYNNMTGDRFYQDMSGYCIGMSGFMMHNLNCSFALYGLCENKYFG